MYKSEILLISLCILSYAHGEPANSRLEKVECRVTVEDSVHSEDPLAPVRRETRETLEKSVRATWMENGVEYRSTDGTRQRANDESLINSFKTLLKKTVESRGSDEIEHLEWTTTIKDAATGETQNVSSSEDDTYSVIDGQRTMVRSVLDGREQPITVSTESAQPSGAKLVVSRIASPYLFNQTDGKSFTAVVRFQKSCTITPVQ